MDSPRVSCSSHGNADRHCSRSLHLCYERYVHRSGLASPSDCQAECRHPHVRVPFWELIYFLLFRYRPFSFYFFSPPFRVTACSNSYCRNYSSKEIVKRDSLTRHCRTRIFVFARILCPGRRAGNHSSCPQRSSPRSPRVAPSRQKASRQASPPYRLTALKLLRHNRHRGDGCPSSPATPTYMRVRIRRFSELSPCGP
jgi:hypothetical protein